MDAFCPRCQASVSFPDEAAAAGACPTCGGQVTTAQPVRAQGVDAVAMTFPATSNVAEPFIPEMKNSALSTGGDSTAGEPQSPADPPAEAPAAASGFPAMSFDFGALPPLDGGASAPAPAAPAAEAGSEPPPPPPDTDDGSTDVPMDIAVDPPAASAAAEAPVSDAPLPETAAAPAHLSLPSFDFSLPSFGASGAETPAAAAPTDVAAPTTDVAPSASGDLPAHMQLPSFPQFDFGAPSGLDASAGAAAEPGMSAHLMPPPLAPGTPPPRPPPRRPTGSPHAGGVAAPPPPLALPSLPSFGGPSVAEKKEVTLLGQEQARQFAKEVEKRSIFGMLLVGTVVLALLGGGGVVAYGFTRGWDKVVALVAPQRSAASVDPVLKAKAEAKAKVVAGMAAYNGKKYDAAVSAYRAALELDAGLAEAHRNLGIALATQKKQAEAVTHYKKYLELSPDAPDAAELKKIVEEYEKTQKKSDDKSEADKPKGKPKRGGKG